MTRRFGDISLVSLFYRMVWLTWILSGCATGSLPAHTVKSGAEVSADQALVVGQIVLVKDGESQTPYPHKWVRYICAYFTCPVGPPRALLVQLESGEMKWRLDTERDGSFAWAMPPGTYVIDWLESDFPELYPQLAFQLTHANDRFDIGVIKLEITLKSWFPSVDYEITHIKIDRGEHADHDRVDYTPTQVVHATGLPHLRTSFFTKVDAATLETARNVLARYDMKMLSEEP